MGWVHRRQPQMLSSIGWRKCTSKPNRLLCTMGSRLDPNCNAILLCWRAGSQGTRHVYWEEPSTGWMGKDKWLLETNTPTVLKNVHLQFLFQCMEILGREQVIGVAVGLPWTLRNCTFLLPKQPATKIAQTITLTLCIKAIINKAISAHCKPIGKKGIRKKRI